MDTEPAGGGQGKAGPAENASELDYVRTNMATWAARRESQLDLAQRSWAAAAPRWGIFGVPESDAHVLPAELEGRDVVELGCGTGYVSAWLARRGARPVAIDPTPSQLAIARRMQGEHGLRFPLIQAIGEQVPLRDRSFDVVISEYGAAIWSDPYRWIPEAARLLRPGGELVFLGNSTLMMLCVPDEDDVPATDRLVRPQFGMYRFEWPDEPSVEFHLSPGDWIRLLRANGFGIEDLIELRAPDDVETSSYTFATVDWARRWPHEEVWRARLVDPKAASAQPAAR